MKRGFTVVELVIVVVVIVLLATITTLGYRYAQDDSRDTARRSAVQQIEQAIQALKLRRDSTLMMGGYGSTTTPDVEGFCLYNATSISSGSTTASWVFYNGTSSYYGCTTGQMLTLTGMLPADFADSIPENEEYTVSTTYKKEAAMTLYRCDTTNKKWILYYYLKNPTAEESDSLSTLRSGCTTGPTLTTLQNTLKMRAAVEINL